MSFQCVSCKTVSAVEQQSCCDLPWTVCLEPFAAELLPMMSAIDEEKAYRASYGDNCWYCHEEWKTLEAIVTDFHQYVFFLLLSRMFCVMYMCHFWCLVNIVVRNASPLSLLQIQLWNYRTDRRILGGPSRTLMQIKVFCLGVCP